MKRIASLFCTVLILLSICTIPASAHEECSFSKNHVPYKVTFPTALMSTMPLLQQSTHSCKNAVLTIIWLFGKSPPGSKM